jgi:DNA polymerase-3 subunit delta
MILFFYGPNTFLISEKLRELKEKYKKAAGGDLNYIRIPADQLSFEQYSRQVLAMPLLSSSRLIIVENVLKAPKELQDRVKETLKNVPASTNLVFAEFGEPDKRLGLLRVLEKEKHQYFKNMLPGELIRYITSRAIAKGSKISREAAQILAEYTLGDLWKIDTELEKLINFASDEISAGDVEAISSRGVLANAFAFADSLSSGNTKKALGELKNLLAVREPPLKILGLIGYQFRSIACVKSALETTQDRYQIAKTASLSPYQVGKFFGLAQKISWLKISQIYSFLVLIDEKIKTGKIEGDEGLKDLVLSLGLQSEEL